MSTYINDILERVAEIEVGIVGPNGQPVRIAEPYLPSDVSRYELPFFINEVEGGPVKFIATMGRQEVQTVLHMHLCLFNRASGNLKEQMKAALQWRDYVLAAFAQHLRLGNDLANILVTPITAWDFVDYEYGSTTWLALRFDLSITEMFILTVAP